MKEEGGGLADLFQAMQASGCRTLGEYRDKVLGAMTSEELEQYHQQAAEFKAEAEEALKHCECCGDYLGERDILTGETEFSSCPNCGRCLTCCVCTEDELEAHERYLDGG